MTFEIQGDSAKNDDDLQALNKFAGSKSFFACKCGRKCGKYPIFATFLTNLRAKIGRKYLRAYLRAKTAPEKHRKIPTFATSEVANICKQPRENNADICGRAKTAGFCTAFVWESVTN